MKKPKLRRTIVVIVLFFMLAGCNSRISLPTKEDYMLITHIKDSVISIFDPSELKVIDTIDIDFTINAIGKQDSNHLLFTKENDTGLFTLNLESGEIKEIVNTLGSGVTNIYDPIESDYIFLADSNLNQVLFYHKKEQEITDRISVELSPMSMTMNTEENLLYVTNIGSASMSVINLEEKRVVKTFPIIDRPSGVFYDGSFVWVGGHGPYGELNKFIYGFDPETGEEIGRIEVGLMPIALYGSESSELYVVCHGSHEVYKVNTEAQTVEGQIEVGQNPYHLIYDEPYLYTTSIDGNNISIIEKEPFILKQQINLPLGPYLIEMR